MLAVNYYPHHIGDYLRDTSHLTATEDGIYRRMLDLYYASEKPLPLDRDWLCRLLRARADEEREAVGFILQHFFSKTDDGWCNKRADEEIKSAAKKAKAARLNGKLGGRPITQRVNSGLANKNPEETQAKAPKTNNQTQNQEPKEKKKEERSRGSRLLPSWQPSEILKAWAVKKRPDLDIESTVEKFVDHWSSVPGGKGLKLDWEATFRNWVRGERSSTNTAMPDYSGVIAKLKD